MRKLVSLFVLAGLITLLLESCATSREGCPMNSTPKTKFRR
ncbi:MAG: hypothetical protein ACKOC7_01080 [Sphingomonadales bacterium]